MAILSFHENDKKENIPPFSSKKPTFLLTKPSSSNNKKRRLRKPLQDITNLILPQIFSTPVQSDTTVLVSSQALASQPNFKKRRDEDKLGSICRKTHFVYKSVNFR
ncbi:hypothetical protein J1N35_039284 [Gossypium stocksii]|uniref:Uncharacterized protein n=1 Tax=Gossypium stocksii TaxID=47602 RepID=A0A9D3ZNQ1_9ROSI|nr:hypothetical protein J1N35_039284 [Gossypium stocksii]